MNVDFLQWITDHQIVHPDSRFNCCECGLLLFDAYQTSCGCFLCDVCRSKLFSPSSAGGDHVVMCPGKTEDCSSLTVDSVRVDNAKRKEVLRALIMCPFSEGKCTQQVEVSLIAAHYLQCEHAQAKCHLCQRMVLKKELNNHQRNDCPGGKVDCPHCGKSLRRRELDEVHLNRRDPQCTKFTFSCQFCNAESLNHESIKKHSEECPHWVCSCPLLPLGCTFTSSREELAAHEAEECSSHLQLMMEYYLKNVNHLVAMKPIISYLKETMKNPAVEERYIKLVECFEKLCQGESSSFLFPNPVANLAVMQQQQNNVDFVKETLEFLRVKQWTKGLFVWKLPNFKQKQTAARGSQCDFVESSAFYSPQIPSYLLQLRAYPNGREQTTTDPYLSLYFRFLPGLYDAVLEWPFNGRIKLQIVHPKNKMLNKSQELCSDPASPCFQRPSSSEGSQSAGIPRFISIQELETVYMINDCIYITCQVVEF